MHRRTALTSVALASIVASWSRSASAEGPVMPDGLFSLDEYDGTADDRLAAAIAAAIESGGGTVFIPAGDWHITRTHSIVRPANDQQAIRFQGVGSASRLYVECGSARDAFYLGNLKHASFADLAFVGGTTGTDCSSAIHFSSVVQAAVERCNFYGLRSRLDGVHAYFSALRVSDCGWFACGATTAAAVGINEERRSVVIERCEFLDVGAGLAGATIHPKAVYNFAWIRVLDFVSGPTWGGTIRIEGCHFDEHAIRAVAVVPTKPETRHRSVEIRGCSQLACVHPDSVGLVLRQIDRLTIDGWAPTVTTSQDHIRLEDVSEARVRGCRVTVSQGVTARMTVDHLTSLT